MKKKAFLLLAITLSACTYGKKDMETTVDELEKLVIAKEQQYLPKQIKPEDIKIRKEFLYDKYTLQDQYPYKDTTRIFQWDKIKEGLAMIETAQFKYGSWGVLQNKSNINGRPPVTQNTKKNEYNEVTDTFGVEVSEGIPLYLLTDTIVPERYALDGSLVKYTDDTTRLVKTSLIYFNQDWYVAKKYIKAINNEGLNFNKVIFVDRKNQNIITLEKLDSCWLVRSMNPSTTGMHKPPYQYPTPLGLFVKQEKRSQMIYLKDGTTEVGGFAPFASRFCNGAFIHGIPVDLPKTAPVEYSHTLGTVPRSHMCVRNATSHAEFIYNWAPVFHTLVFVIE